MSPSSLNFYFYITVSVIKNFSLDGIKHSFVMPKVHTRNYLLYESHHVSEFDYFK